jgi:small-conductance mechanosensitive channel
MFQKFGDSTLDFELRFFVNSLTRLVTIRHEINIAIDDKFKANNVEIAFPQRHLHLRSADGPIMIEGDKPGSELPQGAMVRSEL